MKTRCIRCDTLIIITPCEPLTKEEKLKIQNEYFCSDCDDKDNYLTFRHTDKTPDIRNDLDYSGAIHEIIDGSVPVYTKENEDAKSRGNVALEAFLYFDFAQVAKEITRRFEKEKTI